MLKLELTKVEVDRLTSLYEKSPKNRVRQRSQALLFLGRGFIVVNRFPLFLEKNLIPFPSGIGGTPKIEIGICLIIQAGEENLL